MQCIPKAMLTREEQGRWRLQLSLTIFPRWGKSSCNPDKATTLQNKYIILYLFCSYYIFFCCVSYKCIPFDKEYQSHNRLVKCLSWPVAAKLNFYLKAVAKEGGRRENISGGFSWWEEKMRKLRKGKVGVKDEQGEEKPGRKSWWRNEVCVEKV